MLQTLQTWRLNQSLEVFMERGKRDAESRSRESGCALFALPIAQLCVDVGAVVKGDIPLEQVVEPRTLGGELGGDPHHSTAVVIVALLQGCEVILGAFGSGS